MSDTREKIHLKIAKDRDCHDEGCPDCLALTDSILSIVREAVSVALPKIEQPGKGWAGARDAGRNRGIVECRDALIKVLS